MAEKKIYYLIIIKRKGGKIDKIYRTSFEEHNHLLRMYKDIFPKAEIKTTKEELYD